MSPSNIGVSIDSKAYELALFYVENSSTQMTADEVAQFTRKLALEIRERVAKFLEKKSWFSGTDRWNSSTQMTADEVAQFTRKLGLETRDCALCGYEHFIFAVHQGVRDGFEGEFAFY